MKRLITILLLMSSCEEKVSENKQPLLSHEQTMIYYTDVYKIIDTALARGWKRENIAVINPNPPTLN